MRSNPARENAAGAHGPPQKVRFTLLGVALVTSQCYRPQELASAEILPRYLNARILVSRPGLGIGYGHWEALGVGLLLLILVGIAGFVLWIVCMIKAAQGVRFMVPIAGEIAQNLAGG
jgi:hypothetical protein